MQSSTLKPLIYPNCLLSKMGGMQEIKKIGGEISLFPFPIYPNFGPSSKAEKNHRSMRTDPPPPPPYIICNISLINIAMDMIFIF